MPKACIKSRLNTNRPTNPKVAPDAINRRTDESTGATKIELPTPVRRIALIILVLKGLLIGYLICWAVAYRLPHTKPALVDLRSSINEHPYYVAICAGLASNLHGFPGHGYVVWSESLPINLSECESRGFVPKNFADQIPSLFRKVPGLLVANATEGNLRNFDALVVIVDRKIYEQSKQTSCLWKADNFKVGSSDCVAYSNSIASSLGLKTPDSSFRYPQEYVRLLKALNKPSSGYSKIQFQNLEEICETTKNRITCLND
jgi:hypothetical protein